MKYYVTSDVHGYDSILRQALADAGFFEEKEPHRLVILGDLFDRGEEARSLQDFVLRLMEEDRIILIRGNHEDLFETFVMEDCGRPYRPRPKRDVRHGDPADRMRPDPEGNALV